MLESGGRGLVPSPDPNPGGSDPTPGSGETLNLTVIFTDGILHRGVHKACQRGQLWSSLQCTPHKLPSITLCHHQLTDDCTGTHIFSSLTCGDVARPLSTSSFGSIPRAPSLHTRHSPRLELRMAAELEEVRAARLLVRLMSIACV
eukprot:748292-Prorocentrum_minimum.AAC.1